MTVLTPTEAAAHLMGAGFVGYQVAVMTSVGMAESGLNPYAHHQIVNLGSPAHLSSDDGWLQINSFWTPKLLQQQGRPPFAFEWGPMVYDPAGCAQLARSVWVDAFERSMGNWTAKAVAGYSRWTTYAPKDPVASPPYLLYLDIGRIAARAIGAM